MINPYGVCGFFPDKKKTAITRLILIYFLLVLVPGSAWALMPPDQVARINLDAPFIAVGSVVSTGKVLLPEKNSSAPALKGVFLLKIVHVIKGRSRLRPGDQISVTYHLPPDPPSTGDSGGMVAERYGPAQVRVKTDDLAVVYMKESRHKGFYTPVVQGSSVVVIP